MAGSDGFDRTLNRRDVLKLAAAAGGAGLLAGRTGVAGAALERLAAESGRLREVSWEEWFDTFDQRGLNFIYQEQRSYGTQSNFFQLENPDREDA